MHLSGHPGLHSKFEDSLSYTVRPCLKKIKKRKRKQVSGLSNEILNSLQLTGL